MPSGRSFHPFHPSIHKSQNSLTVRRTKLFRMAADSSMRNVVAVLSGLHIIPGNKKHPSASRNNTNKSAGSDGNGTSFHGIAGSCRGTCPSQEVQLLDVNAEIHIRDETFSSQSSSENETIKSHAANDEIGIDGATKSSEQVRACFKAREQFEGDLMRGRIADLSNCFPSFSKQELLHGRLLGGGSTTQVSQVNGFRTNSRHQEVVPGVKDSGMANARAFVIKHCYRDSGDARYAVKQLRKEVIEDPQLLLQGLADLCLEARLLSHVTLNPHPNVMKLRAVASEERFSPGYFIVMDRLYDTLEQRIEKWKEKATIVEGGPKLMVKSLLGSSAKRGFYANQVKEGSASLWHDRIWAAYDLASAVAHLHKHSIIHRDLKPVNLGFDIRGDLRVFDLGLGKEIPMDSNNDDSEDTKPPVVWKMTKMVGTPRYMAPEVAHGWAYNAKCDVFSYGIIFWQIMGIQSKPYSDHKAGNDLPFFFESVWNGDLIRPSMLCFKKNRMIQAQYTTKLQQWTECCWNHRWDKRPSMMEIEEQLCEMVKYGYLPHATEESYCSDRMLEDSLRFDLVGEDHHHTPSLSTSSPRFRVANFFRRHRRQLRRRNTSSFDSSKSVQSEPLSSVLGVSSRSLPANLTDQQVLHASSSSGTLDQRLDRSRRRSTFVYDEVESGSQKEDDFHDLTSAPDSDKD